MVKAVREGGREGRREGGREGGRSEWWQVMMEVISCCTSR